LRLERLECQLCKPSGASAHQRTIFPPVCNNSSYRPRGICYHCISGGMIPAHVNLTQWGSMADGPVVAHVTSNASYPHGISSNYTLLQQGFTADVTCRQQNFSDTGSGFPSMTLFNATLPLPSLGQSQPGSYTSLVSWAWSTNCTAYSSSCMVQLSPMVFLSIQQCVHLQMWGAFWYQTSPPPVLGFSREVSVHFKILSGHPINRRVSAADCHVFVNLNRLQSQLSSWEVSTDRMQCLLCLWSVRSPQLSRPSAFNTAE
jgi:hypothetical protein